MRDGEYDLDDDEGYDAHKQRNYRKTTTHSIQIFGFRALATAIIQIGFKKTRICGCLIQYSNVLQAIETSVLNGTFWNINPDFEKEIVEELAREGFSVTRRDDLTFY